MSNLMKIRLGSIGLNLTPRPTDCIKVLYEGGAIYLHGDETSIKEFMANLQEAVYSKYPGEPIILDEIIGSGDPIAVRQAQER